MSAGLESTGIADARTWEGVHCSFAIERPAPCVAVVRIAGHDVGELGDAPMLALERQIREEGAIDLFIDAREVAGATIDVSSAWALWLARHRAGCRAIVMLTGSRFVALTAEFVRRYGGLADIMQVHGEAAPFERALAEAAARRGVKGPCT